MQPDSDLLFNNHLQLRIHHRGRDEKARARDCMHLHARLGNNLWDIKHDNQEAIVTRTAGLFAA